MEIAELALVLLALLGHAALWVGVVNRLHATAINRSLMKRLTDVGFLVLGCAPPAFLAWFWFSGEAWEVWLNRIARIPAIGCYAALCLVCGVVAICGWVNRRFLRREPAAVAANHTTVVDVAAKLGHKPLHGTLAKILSHVPRNQALQIAVQEMQLRFPRLPPQLNGFSIAHLTDLHFTGHIGIEYFHEVVRQTTALDADIIALTGDFVDDVELLSWLPAVFSQLRAKHGVYFVLGNHDEFTHHAPEIRKALTDCGMIDMGGRTQRLEIDGASMLLAGNELPWFGPEPDMKNAATARADSQKRLQNPLPLPPGEGPGAAAKDFKLLLAHTPDMLPWACGWGFDLMLAGHNHGGQIRLPLAGPIFSPSWHGVRYAAGTFFHQPTLMHVSRGVSSELPIRLNCPPELSKLVLNTAAAAGGKPA
ncbi:MAG TPA: metallophosphoesterase [Pirellulales bacterium]